MADKSQIQELSMQLINAVEQVRQVDRQIQLGNNQKRKTDLVLAEVQNNNGQSAMYRSLGRMFILCDKEELTQDLNTDLERIAKE